MFPGRRGPREIQNLLDPQPVEPLDLPEENGPPLDSDETFGNLRSKGHEPASLTCGEDDGLLGDHENSIEKV